MEGVWESAKACMGTYLLLADKARAFRADPRVTEAVEYSGVHTLAQPTLDAGESVADFLAGDDGFDPEKAARARLRLRAPEPARPRAPRRLTGRRGGGRAVVPVPTTVSGRPGRPPPGR